MLLSLHKNIIKSSDFPTGRGDFGDGIAEKAVDGNKKRNASKCLCCAATNHTLNTWFRLDLGKDFIIESYEILGRLKPPNTEFENLYRKYLYNLLHNIHKAHIYV